MDRAWPAPTLAIPREPLPPETVISGAPEAGFVELADRDGLAVGVWEMTEGTATDVEQAEFSVVLAGRGTVVVNDRVRIELAPGVLLHLAAGDRTVWTIEERLRKVWVQRSTEPEGVGR